MDNCVITAGDVRAAFWASDRELAIISTTQVNETTITLLDVKNGEIIWRHATTNNIVHVQKSNDYIMIVSTWRLDTVVRVYKNSQFKYSESYYKPWRRVLADGCHLGANEAAQCALIDKFILVADGSRVFIYDCESLHRTVISLTIKHIRADRDKIALFRRNGVKYAVIENGQIVIRDVEIGRFIGYAAGRAFYIKNNTLIEFGENAVYRQIRKFGDIIADDIMINRKNPCESIENHFGVPTVIYMPDTAQIIFNWKRSLFDVFYRYESAETMRARIALMVYLRFRRGLPRPIVQYILSLI